MDSVERRREPMYLDLQHLSKSFGERTVVRDLSLSLEKGQLLCILGSSGCGKTTTLNMIGGFLAPSSGSILLDGEDITALPPELRPVSTVFQSYGLFPHMTVLQNVQYGLKFRHLPKKEAREKALALHASGAELKEGQGRAALKLMGAFRPGEAFMLSLQLSFFSGLIISFPLLLFFLLRFIVPGLLEHERRLLCKSVVWGGGLFLGGCAFAYMAVLPRVLSFFYSYSLCMGIENDWRIGYYLTFAAKLVFVFGAIFELPVVIIPLIKLGILNYGRMKVTRGYALIACFGAALFLAPAPDPATMFIMALHMYALYELCIIFAYLAQRKSRTI